jgi:hypothetical protein
MLDQTRRRFELESVELAEKMNFGRLKDGVVAT